MNVNVNGHLSSPVSLGSGLRQGDPISPLLFNLVMEPLVKSIAYSPRVRGFCCPSVTGSMVSAPSLKVLAYADDLLIFLADRDDLHEVQSCIRQYNLASNAKMNYNKTVAFSVSGAPHPEWLRTLQSYGISKWHDCTADEPLVYLGYPLIQSVRQRRTFQQCLVDSVTKSCTLYKQRSLSIRGRATVLNVLILSKLWHVLRLMWVSQKTFGIIRKICREFIGFRVFPPISLETYQLPTRQGGLGFLEPSQQQSALQYRWLTPFLLDQDSSDFVTLWLKAHILSLSPLSISDARLPFLFPSLRQGALANTTPGMLPVLFRAFDFTFDRDSILRSLNGSFTGPPKVAVDICLSLPLTEVINWPNDNPPLSQRSYRSLTVNDSFTFSFDNSHFVPKTWINDRRSLSHGRYRIGKLVRLLLNGQIRLHPFFARLRLPNGLHSAHSAQLSTVVSEMVQPLLDDMSSTILPRTVRRQHLKALLQRRRRLNHFSNLPAAFWVRFWNLSIPVQIRTPWYRLLQNKFPCSNKLYQLTPSVLSPCCRFCQNSNLEDELHFIVFCPKKFEVWVRIWKHFFGALYITTDDITAALYHLRFPSKKLSAFRNESIFGCTFWCIWRAHWLAIFNDQQFIPEAVFQATLVCLGTFHN